MADVLTRQTSSFKLLKPYLVIVETIVTTVAEDGTVNCASMGVEWGEDAVVLKPFLDTTTYRNVVATRAAVVNLIDDVRVFARAAISNPQYNCTCGVGSWCGVS